jgi:hypothetical protein
MAQFALTCLPDFLKSSPKETFCTRDILTRPANKLKHPKNIATTMTRLSQKASFRSPHFYKRSLFFFSVLCIRIYGAALSNYLDAIDLRFVRHHSIRRHICLHACPFHGFLVGRQSCALSKKTTKRSAFYSICWPKSLLVYSVSQMCII